jgi:protein-S-isoprenylcysteine O-methyltransferase Ste14
MPPNARVVGGVIAGAWCLLALYWLARAAGNKRTARRLGGPWRALFPIGLVLLAHLILHARPLEVQILPRAPATRIAGVIACVAGVALAIGARRALGANWSAAAALKQGHELIRRGPYRVVRHPIYSGLLLAAAGTVAALLPTLQGLACLLILATGLRLKSLGEERLLGERFPEYAAYRREVKALIPFLL